MKKAMGNKFRTTIDEKGKQTKGVKAKGKSGEKAKKKEPKITQKLLASCA